MPYWQLFYHFAWATVQRQPLIASQWEAQLHNVISAKATELGATVLAVGGTADHVHLVASVPPKMALSTFVGQVKGNSSHFVTRVLMVDSFAWQAEYAVLSFDRRSLKGITAYVLNQKAHHADGSVHPSLEKTGEDTDTTTSAGGGNRSANS
jgi:putative transposase